MNERLFNALGIVAVIALIAVIVYGMATGTPPCPKGKTMMDVSYGKVIIPQCM